MSARSISECNDYRSMHAHAWKITFQISHENSWPFPIKFLSNWFTRKQDLSIWTPMYKHKHYLEVSFRLWSSIPTDGVGKEGESPSSSSPESVSESLSNARIRNGPLVLPKSAVTENSRHDNLQSNMRIKASLTKFHPLQTYLHPLSNCKHEQTCRHESYTQTLSLHKMKCQCESTHPLLVEGRGGSLSKETVDV